jgi:YgiT-type zinc finger domain-containing protein
MKCHTCSGELRSILTDMPFKLSHKTIVILKDLPVLQCNTCGEFLIEDGVMERVEVILDKADHVAELEVLRYAA